MRRLCMIAAIFSVAIALPAAAQQALVDRLNEKAYAAMIAEPDKALALATQAERRAPTIIDSSKRRVAIATGLWLQSEALIRLGNAKVAGPRIAKALRLTAYDPRPTTLRGDLLIARAGVQRDSNRPAEALASLQEAFRIFTEVDEPRKQSITLQTMAGLYTQAEDLVSADKYFKQAADVYRGDPQLQVFLFNNRGNVLLRLERPARAEAQYRAAIAVARQLNGGKLLPAMYANLARALHDQDRLDAADAALREGRAIAQSLGANIDPRLLAMEAMVAFRRQNLPLARRMIEQTFAGVDLKDTPATFREAHNLAYRIYSALGEPAKALPHLERVREIGEDTTKIAIDTNTALMAARFDYANQELRIANLKAEELRKSAEFQRTIFLAVGGATLVIIILLSGGLFTIRRSRNQVRDANTELNRTNAALEKALKAKTEFLATTSHEIRTPLNGILGMTQIMLRDPSVSAVTRDRLGIVHGAGTTMRALVDDILDVAKMETGNLTVELRPTDLHAMLRDVSRMWEEQARAKGVEFRIEIDEAPRWIETDTGRLRQMLFNLLSNAVKFTDAGHIALRATSAGERLCLAVVDSGIGIPPDKHGEIFESFKQADSGTTRKFGGTGLGLAIVRNLAIALDGEVSVASVEGEGTTFTVDLPLRQIDAPASAVEVPPVAEAIVVLDRNPIARGMLRTLLAPRFASVDFAATPDEAIERAASLGQALILADEATLKAAGEDPFAALAALVTRAGAASSRVAVLWAKPDTATLEVLRGSKVDRVLAKPIAGPALIAALTEVAGQNDRNDSDGTLVSRAA